eukprot:scaffold7022_cov36-Cyclotella_meneghiniana.AAC.2
MLTVFLCSHNTKDCLAVVAEEAQGILLHLGDLEEQIENLINHWPQPSGGAAIFLYAHDIIINGGINVNGVAGGTPTDESVYGYPLGGGGGGSGGSLKISACNLSFDSTLNSEVQANGGNGGTSHGYGYGGGGGGGGIVKINASNHNIDEIVISNSGGARGEGDTSSDRAGYAGNAGPGALINGVSFATEE